MFKIKTALLFFVLVLPPVVAYGSGKCGGDCTKCHTLSKEEAKEILLKLDDPGAKILKIQMSPARGLWEVAVDNKNQIGIFYIDFSKKYLVAGPLIEISSNIDKKMERLLELSKNRKIDPLFIPLKNALLLGDKKASKTVIVFTDPDCESCEMLHSEMKKTVGMRKDIAFYIKFLPLMVMHPDAYWKSKSIVCNRSLKLLEDNFEKKTIPKTDCNTNEIDDTLQFAQDTGILGAPVLIMPDGSVHMGLLQADEIIKLIDSIKKKGAKK